MLRTLIATSGFSLIALAATTASALDEPAPGHFGDQHQLIISADRVMPLFAYTNYKETQPNGNSSSTGSSFFSLLSTGINTQDLPYIIPRFSLDYTIWRSLTLGGSILAFFTVGGSNTRVTNGQSVSNDSPSITLFGIAPRVGYIIPLGDLFAFWPRGGFSYYSLSSKTTGPANPGPGTTTVTDTIWQFAFDVEPMFALTPANHVAFTFGPAIDIPAFGKHNTDPNPTNAASPDVASFHFGITAGMLAYF
jgi:hypothetical protein